MRRNRRAVVRHLVHDTRRFCQRQDRALARARTAAEVDKVRDRVMAHAASGSWCGLPDYERLLDRLARVYTQLRAGAPLRTSVGNPRRRHVDALKARTAHQVPAGNIGATKG